MDLKPPQPDKQILPKPKAVDPDLPTPAEIFMNRLLNVLLVISVAMAIAAVMFNMFGL
jgi:hypothetical protein